MLWPINWPVRKWRFSAYDSPDSCKMSLEGSIRLPSSRLLALPIDIRQPQSAGAYIITREACERMIKCVLPARVHADDWWYFYGEGVLDRVRCVVPLPVLKSPKLTSTVWFLFARKRR